MAVIILRSIYSCFSIFTREKRTKGHPQTPDMTRKYSRRGFDGLIKIWRKQLHIFDPNNSFEPTDSEGQNEMTEGFTD